jgi:hypothetical protein
MTNVSTGQTRFYTPETMVYAAARARSRCSLATWPNSSLRAASRSTQSRLGSAIAALLDDSDRWVTGQRIEASGVHP